MGESALSLDATEASTQIASPRLASLSAGATPECIRFLKSALLRSFRGGEGRGGGMGWDGMEDGLGTSSTLGTLSTLGAGSGVVYESVLLGGRLSALRQE